MAISENKLDPSNSNDPATEKVSRISKMAIAATGLGIFSFISHCLFIMSFFFSGMVYMFSGCISLPAAILAIIFGANSLAMINRMPERYGGKGYALTGILLGCLFLPLLVVATLVPVWLHHRNIATRAACSDNVQKIMNANILYAHDNHGAFPVTIGSSGPTGTNSYSVSSTPTPASSFTDLRQALSPMSGGIYAAPNNDPVVCLWILVLQNRIPSKTLICPSDPWGDSAGSPVTDNSGHYYLAPWKPNQNSYSIAFPWNNKGAGAAPYWRDTSDISLPLISDMALRQAPGDCVSDTGRKINSSNHQGHVQIVGYGDGHNEITPFPTQSGMNTNDSIYHWGGYDPAKTAFGPDQKQSSSGIILSEPPKDYDIYMVPQRDADGRLW